MSDDLIEVFHRWNATLDVDTRSVTFYVSKDYAETLDDVTTIDPLDPERWDKVLVLPFPEGNGGDVDGKSVTFADTPTFFDHTQLASRFIPIDEFVNAVTRILDSINADLNMQAVLEAQSEDSTWDLF